MSARAAGIGARPAATRAINECEGSTRPSHSQSTVKSTAVVKASWMPAAKEYRHALGRQASEKARGKKPRAGKAPCQRGAESGRYHLVIPGDFVGIRTPYRRCGYPLASTHRSPQPTTALARCRGRTDRFATRIRPTAGRASRSHPRWRNRGRPPDHSRSRPR